jgi:hypothetical protein
MFVGLSFLQLLVAARGQWNGVSASRYRTEHGTSLFGRNDNMNLKIPARRGLAKRLGTAKTRLLEHCANAIERLLPHIEASDWHIGSSRKSGVTWRDGHRELSVVVGLEGKLGFSVSCVVRRLKVPKGVGAVSRTIAVREKAICETIVAKLAKLLSHTDSLTDEVCQAIAENFDELAVADHLQKQHALHMSPAALFRALRELAGQTYENKALTFGCTIDGGRQDEVLPGAAFPTDFFRKKRYRALSDGYYTAYCLSSAGSLVQFRELTRTEDAAPRSYFPDWCRDMAALGRRKTLAVSLTRHGDIVVLDGGSLRFTYRFGTWQYWNHAHLVDLLRNSARVQHVPSKTIPRVVGAIYRAALDVSFRRSGGLFVILRNQQRLHDIARPSDCIGGAKREPLHQAFDKALPARRIQDLPRSIVVELAALDGAVVLSNQGKILAYGAVLQPKKRGKIGKEEGSRTKAAVGASNYGLAVKVSSDGEVAVFVEGREFMTV